MCPISRARLIWIEQHDIFVHIKKAAISLPAVIGALGSPLISHPESDLAIDLYSDSTLIANMDGFDCQISFNSLNKYVTSLSMTIGASDAPLGSHLKSDIATDLYSTSTMIAIKTSLITGSVSDDFKKSATSLQKMIEAYSSPSKTPPKRDLITDLYSVSALTAHYDEMGLSDSRNLFKPLNA
jgi:hypothetical protein